MFPSGEQSGIMRFNDRRHAGQILAGKLDHYKDRPDVVVLALPRGGVPVGFEIARALHAPLDVLVVRKLGVPGQEELAMGAVASGGQVVENKPVCEAIGMTREVFDQVLAAELRTVESRNILYRGHSPQPDLEGRIVILVDDGLATGSTMRAAVRAVRRRNPQRVVIAVPVGARETCEDLEKEADEVVCAGAPEGFYAVGLWYHNFEQTSDEEVRRLMEEAHSLLSRQDARAVI